MGNSTSKDIKTKRENGSVPKVILKFESDGQWANIIEQLNHTASNLKEQIEAAKKQISMLSDIVFYYCKKNNKSKGLQNLQHKLILESYLNVSEGHLDELIDYLVVFKMVFSKWLKNPFDQKLLSYITKKADQTKSFLESLRKF